MHTVLKAAYAIYAFVFGRQRVNLVDLMGFDVGATPDSNGLSITLHGTLVESLKTIVGADAVVKDHNIFVSVIARPIGTSGLENRGELHDTVKLGLTKPGHYEMLFVNRDGSTEKLVSVDWTPESDAVATLHAAQQ